jgi:hypothetical protein
MADTSTANRERANAAFKRKEEMARQGEKAMAEYEANAEAVRQKSAKLKALRIAKETADKDAEPAKKKTGAKKTAAKKAPAKKASAPSKKAKADLSPSAK